MCGKTLRSAERGFYIPETQQERRTLGTGPTQSASAPPAGRAEGDDEEKGVSKGRQAPSRKFGGCPSVPTGAYTAGKYAGNRKTRGL